MRAVFESDAVTDILRRTFPILQQVFCHIEPTLHYPALGRQGADFGKVALEGGKASSGIGCKLAERQVFRKVFLHEIENIDFP